MAQDNNISVSFTEEDIQTVRDAIVTIAGVLKGKAISLTPQERKQYGRVKYEKEVWIDKVKIQMDNNPNLIPEYISKAEFDKDYLAHKQLNELITLLEQQLNLMQDTNMLLGSDLDVNALMFYRIAKTYAAANAPGARTVYDDLKQQYPSTKKRPTSGEEN